MPKQFSTASLRHHIDKHHPDRFKTIVNIEKEAEKAKTNASLHIQKQQNSLKRMLAVEKPNEKPNCPTHKLQMKNNQPTIAQAFSNEYYFFKFYEFI